MDSPVYRIITLCPRGISDQLSDFLGSSGEREEHSTLTMRDIIAMVILDPFTESRLQFCCTFLSWAATEIESLTLQRMLTSLNELTGAVTDSPVTAESFLTHVDSGTVAIGGAYPILDSSEASAYEHYTSVSLLHNSNVRDDLLRWSYRTFLRGALATDRLGVLVAVLATGDEVADRKITEAVSLLQGASSQGCELGTAADDAPPG
jgi:hypothetical protein